MDNDDVEPDRWPDRDLAAALAGLTIAAVAVVVLMGLAFLIGRAVRCVR